MKIINSAYLIYFIKQKKEKYYVDNIRRGLYNLFTI